MLAISAVAQPPIETPATAQEPLLTNRYGSPSSETDFVSVIINSSRAIFSIGHTTGSDKPILDKADWKATRFPSTGLVHIRVNLCLALLPAGFSFVRPWSRKRDAWINL